MANIKDIIFGKFPRRYHVDDINKDGNGKGLFQRFTELLGGDVDDNEIDALENAGVNLDDPMTMLLTHLHYQAQQVGLNVAVSTNDDIIRKATQMAMTVYRHKGTQKCLEILFRWQGWDSFTITEHANLYGFDKGTGFDHPERVFDQGCTSCREITLDLIGSLGTGEDVLYFVNSILVFSLPIDIKLRQLLINGAPIVGFSVEDGGFDNALYNSPIIKDGGFNSNLQGSVNTEDPL